MTCSGTWLASAAVIALTVGVTSRADVPTDREIPLPPDSLIVAADDSAANVGQTDENDSTKMGEDYGTQKGAEFGEAPETDSDKIDQPQREDKTAGDSSGQTDSTPQ